MQWACNLEAKSIVTKTATVILVYTGKITRYRKVQIPPLYNTKLIIVRRSSVWKFAGANTRPRCKCMVQYLAVESPQHTTTPSYDQQSIEPTAAWRTRRSYLISSSSAHHPRWRGRCGAVATHSAFQPSPIRIADRSAHGTARPRAFRSRARMLGAGSAARANRSGNLGALVDGAKTAITSAQIWSATVEHVFRPSATLIGRMCVGVCAFARRGGRF